MYEAPLREVSWIPRTAFQGIEKEFFQYTPTVWLGLGKISPYSSEGDSREDGSQLTWLIGTQAGKWKLLTFKYASDTKKTDLKFYLQEIINAKGLKSLI